MTELLATLKEAYQVDGEKAIESIKNKCRNLAKGQAKAHGAAIPSPPMLASVNGPALLSLFQYLLLFHGSKSCATHCR
jgi:hypothetical protein